MVEIVKISEEEGDEVIREKDNIAVIAVIEKSDRRRSLKRTACIMSGFLVVLSLVTSCLLVRGHEDDANLNDFTENSLHQYLTQKLGIRNKQEEFQKLPSPLSQTSPQARNYDSEEYDSDYYDEEYYDDEYYEDEYYDDEYYGDEHYDDEEYEEDEYDVAGNKQKLEGFFSDMHANRIIQQPQKGYNNINSHRFRGPPLHRSPPRNPSIQRTPFSRPTRNNRQRFNLPMEIPYTTTSSFKTTTTTASIKPTSKSVSTTEPQATIIVVQQPGFNPYQHSYGYNSYQSQPYGYNPYRHRYEYQQPYLPNLPTYPMRYPQTQSTPAATTTTTTKTTIITTTTTKRSRSTKSKQSPYNLPADQQSSFSKGRQPTVYHQLASLPIQQQSIITSRLGLPATGGKARRFKPRYAVRGRKRFPVRNHVPFPPRRGGHDTNHLQSSQSRPSSHVGLRSQHDHDLQGKYDQDRDRYHAPRPTDRRFDMPNIFTQGGFKYKHEERPIISRPPPRHPGVKVPGVRVPPNAGNIEDIIDPKPVQSDIDRYTTYDGKYTINNNYRPPIGQQHNPYKPTGSYVPPNQPPINYKPADHEATPYRPSTYNEQNSYNRPRPIDYEQPSNSYDRPPEFNPPPHTYVTPIPYNPPQQSHEVLNPYNPSLQESPPYNPPQESPPYNPPPQPTPYNPPQQSSPYNPHPPPPSYNPPPPPPPYNPPSPQKPVVPPAYNQDYSNPSDPESIYPGPDIYDGGNIHGPPAVINSPNEYQDKIDTLHQNTDNQDNRNYGQKYNANENMDYPHRPPIKQSPSIYNKLKPTLSSVKEPSNHDPRPNSGYNPTYKPQTPAQTYPSYNNPYSPPKANPTIPHPDGPDYSTGTLIHPPGSKGSAPFHVGLDLYPIDGVSPLGALGKQDIYGSSPSQDNNKQQILLQLNLFSKKPSTLGGSRAKDEDLSMHGRKETPLSSSSNENTGIQMKIPNKKSNHQLFGNLDPLDILQHLLKQSLEKRQIDNDQAVSSTEDIVEKQPKNTHRDLKSQHTNNLNQNQRVKEMMNTQVASEFHKNISEYDYEYDYDDGEKKTVEENVIEDEEGDVKKPEYYYYYYYDYLDPGIDISHELSDSDVESYEPLPTPLWQVGDTGVGDSDGRPEIPKGVHKEKSKEKISEKKNTR